MTTIFRVIGPRVVPVYEGRAGRTITDDEVRHFWEANHDLVHHRGCYVFGMRAGRGMTPAYVGKAGKTFRQEVFADNKLKRYQRLLADYRRGTPVLFFVVAPRRRGAPNSAHIGQLERFLIQSAVLANPDLLNVQNTKADEWGISGVVRGSKGKHSAAARGLRTMLKL